MNNIDDIFLNNTEILNNFSSVDKNFIKKKLKDNIENLKIRYRL